MKIGITYDLKEDYLQQGFSLTSVAEFECKETIDAIAAALIKLGAQAIRIGHIKNLVAQLALGPAIQIYRCSVICCDCRTRLLLRKLFVRP